MLWLRRRRLPEQVDRAGSIARVHKTRKLEEGRLFHSKSVKRKGRFLETPPIVTGGVEIRRLPCLFLSRSNGGARKGAVSATWLSAKSTCRWAKPRRQSCASGCCRWRAMGAVCSDRWSLRERSRRARRGPTLRQRRLQLTSSARRHSQSLRRAARSWSGRSSGHGTSTSGIWHRRRRGEEKYVREGADLELKGFLPVAAVQACHCC